MCNIINADVISETYEDISTGKRQIRRFQRPHSSLKTSQQETPSYGLYCQKVELYTYIFAADSIGLHSLVFT